MPPANIDSDRLNSTNEKYCSHHAGAILISCTRTASVCECVCVCVIVMIEVMIVSDDGVRATNLVARATMDSARGGTRSYRG